MITLLMFLLLNRTVLDQEQKVLPLPRDRQHWQEECQEPIVAAMTPSVTFWCLYVPYVNMYIHICCL